MGTVKFALKLLKLEYKKSLFYTLSLMISSAIIFLFYNYMDNIHIGNSMGDGTTFTSILALVIMMIAAATACFANSFFLSKKTGEIAICTMSGAGVGGVTLYLVIQNFTIILIAMPIGLLIGYLCNPLLNAILYQSLGVHANIWYVSLEALVLAIVSLLAQIAALTISNAGFAYRHDILTLLNLNNRMNALPPITAIRMPIIVYWIVTFIPIYVFFKIPSDPINYIYITMLGLFGVSGLFKRGIPRLIKKIQRQFNIVKSKQLIAFGNFSLSLSKTSLLIQIIILSILVMICLIIDNLKKPQNLTITILSYGIIIFLMSVSILYKVILENSNNVILYQSLYKLGYIKNDLKKIMKLEIILLYSTMLFFPTLYILPMVIRLMSNHVINLSHSIIVILSYLIPIGLTGFIAYFNYKSTILKQLNGGE